MRFRPLTLGIDYASPVDWGWGGNRGLLAWYLALPGFMGGAKWRDLCSSADLSFGNHGKFTNIVQGASSGWRGANHPGGFGAVTFDGSNDQVDLGKPIFSTTDATQAYSCFAWMFTTGTVLGPIVSQYLGSDSTKKYIPLALNFVAGKLSYWKGGSTLASTATALNDGIWHHVGFTKTNAGAIALYRDSIPDGTGTDATNAAAITNTLIGASASGDFFTGPIDDVRIYTRALSAAEVKDFYLESRQGYPQGLRRIRPYYMNVATGGTRIFRSGILTSRTIGGAA